MRFFRVFKSLCRSILWISVAIVPLLLPHRSDAQISYDDLEFIKDAFHDEYDAELVALNADFSINDPPTPLQPLFWWERDATRAAYSSYTDPDTGHRQHYIRFFGGYGRYNGMTIDSAVMSICHELGHGLAGPPFKDGVGIDSGISVEGMADDYAARNCFPRMSRRIAENLSPLSPLTEYAEDVCITKFTATPEQSYCRRFFRALEFDRYYYRTNPDILEESFFDRKDTTIASVLNTGERYYPTAQCRIDTMIAGLLRTPRPRCWWVAP